MCDFLLIRGVSSPLISPRTAHHTAERAPAHGLELGREKIVKMEISEVLLTMSTICLQELPPLQWNSAPTHLADRGCTRPYMSIHE
jgi:hypothetical protein